MHLVIFRVSNDVVSLHVVSRLAGMYLSTRTCTCTPTYLLNTTGGVTRLQQSTCNCSHPRPHANPSTCRPPRGRTHLPSVSTKQGASVLARAYDEGATSSLSRRRLHVRVPRTRRKNNQSNEGKKNGSEGFDPKMSEPGSSVAPPQKVSMRDRCLDVVIIDISRRTHRCLLGSVDGAMETGNHPLCQDGR